MACESYRKPRQTEAERKAEIAKALQDLEKRIASGLATVKVGPQGAVTFSGWENRSGVTDACAFRALSQSWTFKESLRKAEIAAGRKVESAKVLAGVHSHDGGKTWGKH